jgi:CubicO group peptidase (beta-lactamase class C family)
MIMKPNSRHILASSLAMLALTTAMPLHAQMVSETATTVSEQSVVTAIYDAPEDWVRSASGDNVTFTAPEQDAALVVVSIASAANAEAAAAAAWAIHDPGFSRPVRLNSPIAPSGGWEAMRRIQYETSPSEEKRAEAWVHQAAGGWQVILVDGRVGTFAKRSAAVGGLAQSFAVQGYVGEDLSGRTANALTPERIALLEDFVAESAKQLSIPGVGFAVIQNGEVVFEGGVGVKSIESQEPVGKDTLFMIASNTKGMTTLLLAKLVELGKLGWDDRVIDHYPAFRLGDQETTESVLIRHLVCACTGLPRKDMDWLFNNTPTTPASVVFDDLAATAPTSGFGEIFQYNNQMAAAAGYVAGHIFYPDMEIGAAYDKAMQTYIFDPLGMTDTTMSIAQAMKGDFASPYVIGLDGQVEPEQHTEDQGVNHVFYPIRPAGSAWSSPHEMMKYIQNELTQGIGPDGTRLFAAGPLMERRKPSVSSGKEEFYGMGLSTKKIGGIDIVEHGGSLRGYRSQMVIIPGANVGAVILTNSNEGRGMLAPFGRKLIELLYDGKDQAKQQVAVGAEIGRLNRAKFRQDLPRSGDPAILAGLASHYVSDELGPLDIRRDNGEVIFDTGMWSSRVTTKANPDGTISLILTSGSWLGMPYVIGKDGDKRTLTLNDAQRTYVFTETDPK